jgi:hypothetical protein
MKKSLTGVILSGLVFPGFGQIVLGKKGIGVGLIVGTNLGLACLFYSIIKRIPLLLEQIQPELEAGTLDFEKILSLSLNFSIIGGGSLLEEISVVLMAGCWLFAVGHAWHLGSKQDKEPT